MELKINIDHCDMIPDPAPGADGNAPLPRPKLRGFGLVRDRNGKPRVDGDPRELPEPIIRMMTKEEFDRSVEEFEAEYEAARAGKIG